MPSFDTTFVKKISNYGFGDLPPVVLREIFKDGRVFSHFIERFLAQEYGLRHITGCKGHDLVDPDDPTVKYEQKTFTQGGCKFVPSNMLGQGRHFDQEVFDEKSKNLNYIIVSNINFPEIKIRFVKGSELAAKYRNGQINFKDHDAFFNDL
jgi:hypothetical protein